MERDEIRLNFASVYGIFWDEIYYEQDFDKRFTDKKGATTVCTIPADKQKAYKYYRFECSHKGCDYSFAELTMDFKD